MNPNFAYLWLLQITGFTPFLMGFYIRDFWIASGIAAASFALILGLLARSDDLGHDNWAPSEVLGEKTNLYLPISLWALFLFFTGYFINEDQLWAGWAILSVLAFFTPRGPILAYSYWLLFFYKVYALPDGRVVICKRIPTKEVLGARLNDYVWFLK